MFDFIRRMIPVFRPPETRKVKRRWNSGDIFLIPNADGRFTPGQVIAREERTLACASCALFDQRVSSIEEAKSLKLEVDQCFSALLVTTYNLNTFKWKVVKNEPVILPKAMYPFEEKLRRGGLHVTLIGCQIVCDFVDAFYKLRPWDDWHEPDFLDKLLISPHKKPKDLIFTRGK